MEVGRGLKELGIGDFKLGESPIRGPDCRQYKKNPQNTKPLFSLQLVAGGCSWCEPGAPSWEVGCPASQADVIYGVGI